MKLASEGARVIVHYNSREEGATNTLELIQASSNICDGIIQCDFRYPNKINEMMEEIDDIWDREIDILINNAGIVTKLAVDDDSDDLTAWHETMAVRFEMKIQNLYIFCFGIIL